MSDEQQDEKIAQFFAFTGVPDAEARQWLEANQWNVEGAVDMWFQNNTEHPETEPKEPSAPSSAQAAGGGVSGGGGRTLAGGAAPPHAASSSSSRQAAPGGRARPRGGPVTLGDLSGGSHAHGHGHGHDDDDEDDEHNKQDFFAGGEKSGLAVQNPNNPRDYIERIFQRAQENAPRPGAEDDEEEEGPSHFTGRGVTLGGDDAPSQVIDDPAARRPQRLARVTRTLHVWRNGFSIDDGPLRDPQADPENARILQMILNGHAPLHILNVEPGQEVDLDLDNRREEEYVAPKPQYKAFSGSGQRLGEAGPNPPSSGAESSSAQASAPSTTTSSAPDAPAVNVDSSQPTITLQIRLGDGTRLQSRFNTTHTIGDVYGFVNAASTASQQRQYVLSSTFPPKDFEDKAAVLGELAEFKRGGVMVQKWK